MLWLIDICRSTPYIQIAQISVAWKLHLSGVRLGCQPLQIILARLSVLFLPCFVCVKDDGAREGQVDLFVIHADYFARYQRVFIIDIHHCTFLPPDGPLATPLPSYWSMGVTFTQLTLWSFHLLILNVLRPHHVRFRHFWRSSLSLWSRFLRHFWVVAVRILQLP